ncbi:MAG: VWA domain-containing protein [Clostridiales bacterium]|jgi:Mg-chelatase subunit ChlD|nr:VWA domain-containing protein [Eubacteriales bacterium]MDH7566235.1 VWA domain-containing protein [Clostridiales bacterium]
MSFNTPVGVAAAAVCAAAAGYFILCALKLYKAFPRKKFILWAALRFSALLCLMLVLAGVKPVFTARETATLFLVDRSLSVSQLKGEVEEYISRQIKNNKKAGDVAGVVSFAGEPMTEVPLSKERQEVKLEAQPDPEATNLEKALQYCRDLFPRNDNKRLVVFTDGLENSGNAAKALDSLEESGINTVLFPLKASRGGDVQLTSMQLPDSIHRGEKVPLKVAVDSDKNTAAAFYLYNGTTPVLQKQLEIREGRNTYDFDVTLSHDLQASFKGEIVSQEDSNPKNNVFTLTPHVKDTPSVLVVGAQKDTANINALLDSLGLKRTNYAPDQVPGGIGFLSSFSEVILANAAHGDLSPEFENGLEMCVKEKGTGLIVVGGENTFAPGGYENTRLEEMLPVACSMKGKKQQPDTGLVLVLDCSGSMDDTSGGVKKMDLVKGAAVKSSQVLEQEDFLGIIGFSDVVEWVVPFGQVRRKEQIQEDIGKLAPRGGTLILPALEKAAEALEGADAKVKHIILLTDGQAEKSGYEGITDTLKKSNITLSTVAVGKDADRTLLESLAKAAGGRSYYARDLYEVPEIFTKETYLGTKKYLNSEEFTPQKADESELFKNVALPKLQGYTGTGIKDGADLILKSNSDDPILAQWSYGLGRVAVWTPDLSGKWSRDWVGWDGFPREWGKLVNSCLSPGTAEDMDLRVVQNGYNVTLSAGTGLSGQGQAAEAEIRDQEGGTSRVRLEQVRTGEFEGTASLDKTGEYLLTLRVKKDGQMVKSATRVIHIDYSPEYALYAGSMDAYYSLAKGGIANRDTNIFSLPLNRKNSSGQDPDFILLPLALLLFIADIWVRKTRGRFSCLDNKWYR